MDKYDLISIGAAVVDIPVKVNCFPEDGTTQFVPISYNFGGCAMNSAVAAARLQLRTKLIAKVGKDDFGELIKNILTKEGIDYELYVAEKTGICICIINKDQRSFLFDPGSSAKLTAEDIPTEELNKAKCVLINGYFHVPGLRDQRVRELLLSYEGLRAFDFGWDGVNKWLEDTSDVLPLIDILFINNAEILQLSGKSTIDEAVASLKERGVRNIILKQGANGATFYGNEVICSPGFKCEVIDTTAAGDAFDSAFLSMYLQQKPIKDCLRFANAVGCLTVQRLGTNFPTLEEVQQFLKNAT